MSNSLPQNRILRATLRVLYVAAYTTRNWTLSEDVARKQINDLWEAIHDIPDLIQRWPGDEEGLRLLRMYFRGYQERWPTPNLQAVFDQALNDPTP